jgi:hypothetical protein
MQHCPIDEKISPGPWCRYRREHAPTSDIDTAAADSLKVLDPKRPIREADIAHFCERVENIDSVGDTAAIARSR